MRFTAFLGVLGLTVAAGCNFGIGLESSECDPGYDDIIHSSTTCDGNVMVTMSTSCGKDLGTSRQACSSHEICTSGGCVTPCTSDSDCPSGLYCPPFVDGGALAGGMGLCTADLGEGADCSNDLTHCRPGLVCMPSYPSRAIFNASVGAPTGVDDAGTAGDGGGVAPWVPPVPMSCRALCAPATDPIAAINAANGACITPCAADSDCIAGTVCPSPADAPLLADGRPFCFRGIGLFADCTDEPAHCLPGLVCASEPYGDAGRLACQPDTQALTPRCNAGAPSVCVGGDQFTCPLSAQTVTINPCDDDQFCAYDANGVPFCANTAVPSPLCQNVVLGTTCAGSWSITCDNGYVTDYADCHALFQACAGDGITAPGACTMP